MTDKERAYEMLRRARGHLTKQQYKTLCGQVNAGAAPAAMRGLEKIIKRNARKEAP